jgi:hypothetical protein
MDSGIGLHGLQQAHTKRGIADGDKQRDRGIHRRREIP